MEFSQIPVMQIKYEACLIVTYSHTILSCLAFQSNERPGGRL